MLLSSTGLSYAKHFCGEFEMLAKVTLGEKHLSCDMALEDAACGDESAEERNCCDNEYTQVEIDDHFSENSFHLDFQQHFAIAYVVAFYRDAIDIPSEEENRRINEYDPPPLIKDLPVLLETFLI